MNGHHTKRRLVTPWLLALAPCLGQAFNSGSTGADGALTPAVDITLPLPASGIFNYTTVNIPVGVTVKFKRNTANTPVVMLASGDVTIAGTLSRLIGSYPDWTPGVVELTRLDATHWRFIATALESTALEYKYVIASDIGDAWAYVEKDGSCAEIGNRLLTVSYGLTGNQAVNDTVMNWRNVAPCGN